MRDQCVKEMCVFFVFFVPFAETLPQVIEQSLFLFYLFDKILDRPRTKFLAVCIGTVVAKESRTKISLT